MIMVLAPHRAVKAAAVGRHGGPRRPRDRAAEEPAAPAAARPRRPASTAAAGETGAPPTTSGE